MSRPGGQETRSRQAHQAEKAQFSSKSDIGIQDGVSVDAAGIWNEGQAHGNFYFVAIDLKGDSY